MILAIDVGNTNIVAGCIDGEKIYFVERMATDPVKTELEYAIMLKNVLELYQIDTDTLDGIMISSVVPPLNSTLKRACQKIADKPIRIIGPGIKTGLNILMDNPATVGSDMIVCAVAAVKEYALPIIFIDMGTATTVSVVDSNKNYIGGCIMPGIATSVNALVANTAQLPKISMEAPKKVIGKNTIDCMKSGVIYGNAACLDGIIERIEEELGEKATILATGGLAPAIVPHCKRDMIIDDALLLKGLQIIFEKNTK